MASAEQVQFTAFPSELGWMALVASQRVVKQSLFAQPTPAAAISALDAELVADAEFGNKKFYKHWQWLIEHLQEFAKGRPVDFSDVPIDVNALAPFQKEVVRQCRAIPYGQTRSYGEVAELAGSPRAARAVGTAMAHTSFGLIVPCHRVINADGSPGSYGTPAGARTKRKLLELEQHGLATYGKPKKQRRRATP